MNNHSILAIIPARGGSKGIPRKNILDVCGKPLIAWSITTGIELVKAGAVDRSIVTTEDYEISNVALQCGGDVPFIRPSELATDTTKSIDFILHALDWFEDAGTFFDSVLLLQPTSPQRSSDKIAAAIEKFIAQDKAQSLISCYQEDYINDFVMYEEDSAGYLKPKNQQHNKGVRRQDHKSYLVRNGAVYLTNVDYLRRTRSLICDSPMLLKMGKIESINLDVPEDMAILRNVMCG